MHRLFGGRKALLPPRAGEEGNSLQGGAEPRPRVEQVLLISRQFLGRVGRLAESGDRGIRFLGKGEQIKRREGAVPRERRAEASVHRLRDQNRISALLNYLNGE